MAIPVTQQDDTVFDWEKYIQTLGYANRFATWDSEFRYDGRFRVDAGVEITEVKYSYQGELVPQMRLAKKRDRGQGGMDDEYEVIDVTSLDTGKDVVTFTLRGDLDVDRNPREEKKPSFRYNIVVDVALSDGTHRTARPEIEVLTPTWEPGAGEEAGRPFVRLPHDGGYGLPNSQAGFGYVADEGRVEEKFVVDLVNPRQYKKTRDGKDVEGNHSGYVYWQLVHEDGTPSHVTPAPTELEVTGHSDGVRRYGKVLDPINLREANDKPGYYRFLVWPQCTNGAGRESVSRLAWDPHKPEDAFQLGSVYYRYTAPHSVGFTVSPGGANVDLIRGGPPRYPGVELEAQADGTVSPQTVRVSLPPDRGLEFVEEGDPGYQLTVQGSVGAKYYLGTLSRDGQTLTFTGVDPALAGKGTKSAAWVAVRATDAAPASTTRLNFEVGSQTSPSTQITVVDPPAG